MILFAEGDGIILTSVMMLAGAGVLGGVITFLFKLLLAAKDQVIAAKDKAHELALSQLAAEKAEEESRKKSYAEIAKEAVKSLTETDAFYRQREGKPPAIPVAPVVSESHSPSTAAQRETAEIATMRAAVARIKLDAGQEPRIEPEPVSEAVGLKRAIQQVPEQTAAKVVEKLKGEGPH
jgi:hypothetical protein